MTLATRGAIALSFALALSMLATPTRAAPADLEATQARIDAAQRLFESKLYDDAREVLETVAAELGAEGEAEWPLIRFMIARCLVELEDPEAARAALDRFDALARTDEQRALSTTWRAKIAERFYGEVEVQCPEGHTLERDGGPPIACPAQVELRAGSHRLVARGEKSTLVSEVEVIAGESVVTVPSPPAEAPRWWSVSLALTLGGGGLSGELAQFIEPSTGLDFGVELLGSARVFGPLGLGLGVGYGRLDRPFTDTDASADGAWQVDQLIVPLTIDYALPADIELRAGAAAQLTLASQEQFDGSTTDLVDNTRVWGVEARASAHWSRSLGPMQTSVGLRYRRDLMPLLEIDGVEVVTEGLELVVELGY